MGLLFIQDYQVKRSNCKNMDSISKECNELKQRYDSCFNAWFTEEFLKNQGGSANKCDALFKEYKDCVRVAITKQKIELWEIERDVLGTDKEKKPPPIKEEKSSVS